MNKYPTAKVILGYTLLGGFMGGLLFVVMALISSAIGNLLLGGFSFNELVVKGLVFFIIIAVIMGAIPAFLAGLIISLFKIRLYGFKEVIKCFFVGFLTSSVFFMWLGDYMSIIVYGIIGGVSSVILAFLLLPKRLEKKGE